MSAEVEPVAQNRSAAGAATPSTDRRWLALVILCLDDLMIVLDVTIVGVALPSIRGDLGFSEESLAWAAAAGLGALLRVRGLQVTSDELEEAPDEPAPCCAFSVGDCPAAEQVA
jgi:hypothetical protein